VWRLGEHTRIIRAGNVDSVKHPRRMLGVVNHYGAGSRFELCVKAELESNGYVVTKAAGSKGKLDLIAVKPGELLFVQAKRHGVIGPAEWDRVVELAGWVDATALLARAGRTVDQVIFWELLDTKEPGRSMVRQFAAGRARPWTPDHGFEVAG
jgi:Holliday junction resolvase